MALTGKQRRHLRALAHHINPVVLTGAAGVSESVVEKTKTELEHHELIKVKVAEGPATTKEAGADLAKRADAELVQVIGRMVVLYKPNPEDPGIQLPSV